MRGVTSPRVRQLTKKTKNGQIAPTLMDLDFGAGNYLSIVFDEPELNGVRMGKVV